MKLCHGYAVTRHTDKAHQPFFARLYCGFENAARGKCGAETIPLELRTGVGPHGMAVGRA